MTLKSFHQQCWFCLKPIYSRFSANKNMLNAGGGECCRAVLTGFHVVGSQNSRIALNDMVFDVFFIVSSEQN